MLFRIQHGLVDVTIDYIQPNDTRTRGSQRLRQLQTTQERRLQVLFLPPYYQ